MIPNHIVEWKETQLIVATLFLDGHQPLPLIRRACHVVTDTLVVEHSLNSAYGTDSNILIPVEKSARWTCELSGGKEDPYQSFC